MNRKLTALAITCLALAGLAASPLYAQVQAPAPPDNPARREATRFETVLRGAIEDAGRQLAQQARRVAPELTLQVTDPAVARGWRLTGYGFFFDVQAPDIRSTLIALEDMMSFYNLPRPVQPVGSAGNTAPPLPTPSPNAAIMPFNPDETYTGFVREAVIDALLESSGMLSLTPAESLTISVSGIDQPGPNPLLRTNSARLILSIRASDLIDFRQGRLTKEQVTSRIAQERF